MDRQLSDRQQQILATIERSVRQRGYPPSVREIGEAVGLRSPSSVKSQMDKLEEWGYLRRDPARPRALEVIASSGEDPEDVPRSVQVPLVGEIAAGGPIVAEQHIEDRLVLPEAMVGSGTLFALTVRGESMIEAGVLDGDVVVIRQQPTVEQGEMCAALIDGEATVKFFRRTRSGEVFLDPANERYEPIPIAPGADSAIMGKVVTVMRRL